MAEGSTNGHHEGLSLHVNDSDTNHRAFSSILSLPFMQKLIAELLGTYFVIFSGQAAVMINLAEGNLVTLPGISIVWGLAVMVMIYSVGHISGAHFNPAVTIAFASCKRFPWKEVPPYIMAQVAGSTLASGTLRLIFNGKQDVFPGTLPSGSDLQSFVLEFVITFYLMFVISGVATDNRAIGELAGLAVGATILVNVMTANIRCINESSQESGASNSSQQIHRDLDLHGRSYSRCRRGCMGLQYYEIYKQALARDHQECLFS
ncbi:aquaporin NIP1-1 isoform X3 [Daucus carota subsp. sativus]|uniref:aquaporin NIP1-1 isoform X3 n=1 Tax=Daucus carota subsp. sativus TaxID=79200 RepID=UPI00308316DD